MRRLLAILLLTAAPAMTGVAQTPAAPVPDRIPFDTPYGPPIGLSQAQKLVAAVEAEASRRGWAFNVSVVDPHGDLVAFARMDGAQLASVTISQRKARIAARFRRETRVFYDLMEKGHGNVATLDPDMVASPGGFPLVVDGKLIGALGCSGGAEEQDAIVCKAGLDALK